MPEFHAHNLCLRTILGCFKARCLLIEAGFFASSGMQCVQSTPKKKILMKIITINVKLQNWIDCVAIYNSEAMRIVPSSCRIHAEASRLKSDSRRSQAQYPHHHPRSHRPHKITADNLYRLCHSKYESED